MKFSIYFYLFNTELREFDAESTVQNFCQFADEVICATVKSEDNTRSILSELEKKYSNFKVIDSDITIGGNNRFDGQLKTLAMKNCKNDIRIIADADERFLLSQKELWESYADQLSKIDYLDGFFIPVIDLYGSKDKIRSNVQIGQKFRMHKNTVAERGVPKIADYGKTFDTSRSDSTDPIDRSGNLSKFGNIVNPMYLNPIFSSYLKSTPYVIHEGFLQLDRRAKIGKEFWKSAWEARSGHEENVVTDVKNLISEPTIFHNLPLN